MKEQVIIVEQAHMNMFGEWCPIAYVPVDSEKAAAELIKCIVKEYENRKECITKKVDTYSWMVEFTETPKDQYLITVKRPTLLSVEDIKERIETWNF